MRYYRKAVWGMFIVISLAILWAMYGVFGLTREWLIAGGITLLIYFSSTYLFTAVLPKDGPIVPAPGAEEEKRG